jgi:hypothetical protein
MTGAGRAFFQSAARRAIPESLRDQPDLGTLTADSEG